ncbi:MAG: hypothetical protein RR162_04890 [Oscillospiraceae bacterium]
MQKNRMDEDGQNRLYQELIDLSSNATDMDLGYGDRESPIWQKFALACPMGKQLYTGLSDEQILKAVRDKAEKLNHSPSQKEMFWVWREYIKARFKKWPYALKAAGLDRSAGSNGIDLERAQAKKQKLEQSLQKVREKAQELGRIPHPKDLPELSAELKKSMHTWGEVIEAAGLDSHTFAQKSLEIIDELEPKYKDMLRKILKDANQLGRAPIHSEVDPKVKAALTKRCGSWRNALHQIGLEPVARITPFSSTLLQTDSEQGSKAHSKTLSDCYYKLLSPTQQTVEGLQFIKDLSVKLGRAPQKNEVPLSLRKALQEECGSWSNVMFQIGYKGGKPV